MTEQQAWEQLYGRRTPDVRVLGRYGAEDEEEEPRKRPEPRADQGDSEAHAA